MKAEHIEIVQKLLTKEIERCRDIMNKENPRHETYTQFETEYDKARAALKSFNEYTNS